ncbi:unnamed protein product [Lota lota]
MTISSRKGSTRSSSRAPKFLDVSGGFYGRLDEPEGPGDAAAGVEKEREQGRWDGSPPAGGVAVGGAAPGPGDLDGEGFDANDGVTEGDDGETLLCVKFGHGGGGSRWSRRSRRSSRRKPREAPLGQGVTPDESPAPGPETAAGLSPSTEVRVTEANESMGTLIQFTAQEDTDDQVLIRDKNRGREEEEEEEGEEERRLKREQEEGMKTLKRNTVKNYRKALDRAFRRGWEAFITNLYSVTLTPVTSSTSTTCSAPSPKSSRKKLQSNIILAEFQ